MNINNSIKSCRVCSGQLYPTPLLRLENMPNAAQFMPDADTLDQDIGSDLEVCQCSACSLIQLNSQPVHYYREVVRAAAYSPEMRSYRLEQFAELVTKHQLAGKKGLEVGCGRGEYLELLQLSGIDAHGLEFSSDAVIQCQQDGYTAFPGFIDTADHQLPTAPYDAFFILNFLEHLPQPHITLRGIANNLAPDAVGLVEVPNFDMILKKRLFSEFINDHLFYFTGDTMSKILAISGFTVLDCQETWHDYIISATVKKSPKADLDVLTNFQAVIHQDLHNYLDRFKNKKVAIWGAGHQALAVISLLKLQDRVSYVVDSAPFKQGKFTPASHLPIVSPATLQKDPVAVVIVMAASYSDEVARIIRAEYDPNMAVAILRDSGLEIV